MDFLTGVIGGVFFGYLWARLHFSIFSTGPKSRDGAMVNLDFENFFGSSVAIHKKKAVSCAYREQPKGKPYVDVQSTMGKNCFIFLCFFHPLFCTIVTM